MTPGETGRQYDELATWWDAQQARSTGLPYLHRAITLCAKRGTALDVGCGSGGRVIDTLTAAGFAVTGIDVSEAMLALARKRHPDVRLLHADVCQWQPTAAYDLIVAWDSIFHVERAGQREVVSKLCAALAPGGVILFTAGGIDSEVTGEMQGRTFSYGSLADAEYLAILNEHGCRCVLLERDQHPEMHMVVLGVESASW